MSGKWFRRLFAAPKVHCDDLPLEDQLEEQLSMEEEEVLEEASGHIPSYPHILDPVKILTNASPGVDVEGFRFSLGIPLSNNFLTQNTINLSSKKAPAAGAQMFDMMGVDKTPFYQLGLQYHHGNLTGRRPHPVFSLMGSYDSNGRISGMFFKNIGKFRLRFQGLFPSDNLVYAQSSVEIEHAGANTKQTFTFSNAALNYNLVERLGRALLLGFDLTYLPQQNIWFNGFNLRYAPRSTERFYLQYAPSGGMSRNLTLGALFKLNQGTTMVTELEYGGHSTSEAAFGYLAKGKSFQVESFIRTNGDLRSVFSYSPFEGNKIKLFLSGNLNKEEFKSGICYAMGQTDD